MQRDGFEVVLVSPRNPLNIGAVARAMANFGFERLSVVAPFGPHWREAKSAVGAPGLLEHAREFSDLRSALAECTFAAGTGTRTHRRPEQPVISLPDLAPILEKEFHARARVALVFGPEKHGLTRDDLSFCNIMIEIPTDPRQPSMNLGQAAAVCLYELSRSPAPLVSPDRASATPATSGWLDRLAELIDKTMIAAEYSPDSMRAANQHDVRTLLRKLSLSTLDTRRMMGLFRRILWRLEHPGGSRRG